MLNYAWLMLVFPAAGVLTLTFFGTRLGRRAVSWLAPAMVLLSFGVAVWMFVTMLGLPAEQRSNEIVLWSWMTTGTFHVDVALLIDQLSITMALVVTGIGFLIHVYSTGYMHDDVRHVRFFTYLNLFILMMLTLVLANNYLLLYVGWEGVGLCSYLLIGFWFEKPAAADAGKKAFIVNRIGDFGLALAIFFIWTNLATLNFSALPAAAAANMATTNIAATGVATTITLLLLLAATGKSAQLPLFVWLPDAMEGPTPVSALIHAATMVTAGVYLIARSHFLYALAPTSASWVSWVGAITALFAATIALTQTDLKRILAYSTISQLGYMFLAVGIGAYGAGIFHLVTHAFFKALLFLGAGSVMHALAGEMDIRKMGNLRTKMRVTYWTFLIGAAALAGIPLLAGFFSKDQILWEVWLKSPLLWLVGIVTAGFTAVYSFRAVFVPFWGKERDQNLFRHVHESPRSMTVPLILLAIGTVLVGYAGLPRVSAIAGWLEPVFAAGNDVVAVMVPATTNPTTAAGATAAGSPLEWVFMAISALIALGGLAVAYWAFVRNTDVPARVRQSLGPVFTLVEQKYYIDDGYNAVVRYIWVFSRWLARVIDQRGIDGVVNGVASITGWAGGQIRRLQTGLVGLYALSILFGAAALIVWFVIK